MRQSTPAPERREAGVQYHTLSSRIIHRDAEDSGSNHALMSNQRSRDDPNNVQN